MLSVLLFILLGMAAIVVQMALPEFYTVLGGGFTTVLPSGGEPLLYMVVLVAAAMKLGDWRALVVAAVLGICFDLVTPNRLGISLLGFSLITALLISQANTRLGRHLIYQVLLALVAAFLYQTFSYILVSIQLWRWRWPLNVWAIIVVSSLLTAALYAVIGLGAALLKRRRRPHTAHETPPSYAHR
ncbi:MAG: rod shape-determining protein MreD [Verrucomicrobiota bacterium]